MKITKVESKNADWKVISLTDNGTAHENVSVNRKNSKGEVFPNFDGITEGADIEGNLWQSPAGKTYLFGPKAPAYKGAGGPSGMNKAIEKKQEGIKLSQEHKDWSIMTASTFTQAWNIALREIEGLPFPTDEDLLNGFRRWRQKLINEWDVDTTDKKPF